MVYRHKLDRDGSCSRMGKRAEGRFVDLLSGMGFGFEAATLEGQFSHRDFHLDFDGSVDVKSRKRVARSDDSVQDELVWLEFKNGRGYRGWLEGKATWIAFEVHDGFVVFRREPLLQWAKSVTNMDKRVQTPALAEGNLYVRGLAEITLQPMERLRKDLPHFYLKA